MVEIGSRLIGAGSTAPTGVTVAARLAASAARCAADNGTGGPEVETWLEGLSPSLGGDDAATAASSRIARFADAL
jgi:hypothetical protein